jgi:hypothetical protein
MSPRETNSFTSEISRKKPVERTIKLIEHQPEISSIFIIPRIATELQNFSKQL